MAKVEDTGNGGIPVAHIDSPGKYPHLKPIVEEKDPVPEKAAGMNFLQTSRSELDLEVTPEEEQEMLNGSENNHPQVEGEKKMHSSSEMDVIENVHNADADNSDALIQQKSEQTDKQPFPIIGGEYSDGSTEKTPYKEKTFREENKVKQKFSSLDDLDDVTQSSETFSEHCELPYSNCKNLMLLIEQLGMDCKDPVSLLKIQDALLSYERLIELKKNHCEILTGKIKKMENRISELQKELSETKEMKSQLEHEKVEWEQELCNLRFTLKEEKEKRRNVDVLYDKVREQLRKKEEQYIKVVEMNQQLETTLRTLDMDLKIVKKNLNQNDDLTAKLEAASLKCRHLDEKNKCLQQDLLSMKALQKKCEKLKNDKRKWKQEGIHLKTHMEMNMVEFSELEQYKRRIEERARQDVEEKLEEVNLFLQTQAASQENLEQLRENHNAAMRSQLELRITDLESELSKIKISQNSKEIHLEKYKQLYLEEVESRKSLTNILNKTNERLAELSTELLLQKQQNRSLLSSLPPKPGLEMPCVGNLNSHLVLCGNFTPRENLVVPTSRPQTSSKSMETYLLKMGQEFEKSLTRELREDAAEFEAEAYRACPVASTDQANSCQDLIFKTYREYEEILRKNYMI